jgi:hypothetical protein
MTVPAGTQFVGISPDVSLVERKSSRLNNKQAIYTIEDIVGNSSLISRSTTTATITNLSYQWNGDTTSAGFTYTLPVGVDNESFKIVNVGSGGNLLTITPNGAEKLLGANSSFALSDGESLEIAYNSIDGWY